MECGEGSAHLMSHGYIAKDYEDELHQEPGRSERSTRVLWPVIVFLLFLTVHKEVHSLAGRHV
jgi:hypothetical protein